MTDAQLEHLEQCWNDFPKRTFYSTSENSDLLLNIKSSMFVFSVNRGLNITFKPVDINLVCFEIYAAYTLNITEPIGYVIIPTIPDDYRVRYTPVSLTATNKSVTAEAIISSEMKSLLETKYLEIVWYSCGVEIIADVWQRLGVYPNGDKNV